MMGEIWVWVCADDGMEWDRAVDGCVGVLQSEE